MNARLGGNMETKKQESRQKVKSWLVMRLPASLSHYTIMKDFVTCREGHNTHHYVNGMSSPLSSEQSNGHCDC